MPLIPRAEPLLITPPAATACVIFLHGLTGSGFDFKPVAERLALRLPHTRFVLPHAPVRAVTWAGNQAVSAWYDLPGSHLRQSNFLQNEDEAGLSAATAYLHHLIDEQVAQGIDSRRLFIGGFSQGCALSLLAGLRYAAPLGGIFGLSGYLPLAAQWPQCHPANRHTPIFVGHGEQDQTITLAQISKGYALLAQERDFSFQRYPIGHQISAAEIDDLAAWLAARSA
ncbi:phospholipase [Chelonobacter oris]|uniref:alpha/beta hydrolase n=1 Tax=Chelonobacter oris TaxID=505317 RepID=UPI002448D64E|nr:phospholipase [Chelonobacter oris]MDH3000971.1 phospholipase [Chelonobacter oris]